MPRALRRPGRLPVWFAGAIAGAMVAAVAPPPARAVLDAGTYRLEWQPRPAWRARVIKPSALIVFQYLEEPARAVAATVGVFRLVVRPPARHETRLDLARACAERDASGAQQALFHAHEPLMPFPAHPRSCAGGEVFRFVETKDANYDRISSTKFFRAWVYFPQDFDATGALYLILGQEQSGNLRPRPTELDFAEQLIPGLRER